MGRVIRHLFAPALLLMLTLAACGFTPVYAPGSATVTALSDIMLEAPRNRTSYLFVREMEERLGRPAEAGRLLRYRISIRAEGVESDTERRRYVGIVTYHLVDRDSGARIASGTVDSFTGYSVSDGLFVSADQKARERLIVILADQVMRELMVRLSAR